MQEVNRRKDGRGTAIRPAISLRLRDAMRRRDAERSENSNGVANRQSSTACADCEEGASKCCFHRERKPVMLG